jgi:hypothetical protein
MVFSTFNRLSTIVNTKMGIYSASNVLPKWFCRNKSMSKLAIIPIIKETLYCFIQKNAFTDKKSKLIYWNSSMSLNETSKNSTIIDNIIDMSIIISALL